MNFTETAELLSVEVSQQEGNRKMLALSPYLIIKRKKRLSTEICRLKITAKSFGQMGLHEKGRLNPKIQPDSVVDTEDESLASLNIAPTTSARRYPT